MLRKIGIACLLATALTSCDQNVTATIYVRDIQDLLSQPTDRKTVPVELSLEVLGPGLSKQCDKPETKEMVSAVASHFDSATLVGCEEVSGAMYDVLKIKATTVLEVHAAGADVDIPQLIKFSISRPAPEKDVRSARIFAEFNKQAYDELNDKLRSINMMAQLSPEDAKLTVVLNNDSREPFSWLVNGGTWLDGKPRPYPDESTIDARGTATVKFGDVSMAFLTSTQNVEFGAYLPNKTQ